MKTSTSSNFLRQLLAPLCAVMLSAILASSANAQTYFNMASGDFSENFASITNTNVWVAPSTGSWQGLLTNATGSIPSATRITSATTNFVATSSGGAQRGPGNLQLLSTGATNDTSSTGIDLLLNFSGRNAGNMSFDAAQVANSSGNRVGTLRAYFTTNGTTWSEISGGGLPFAATNNVAGSSAISVSLPAAINNSPTVQLRFYYNNGTGGSTGSRPKISIDNVLVTSTPASTAPSITSFSPSSGLVGSTVTINGSNFGATPGVKFNGIAAFSSVNGAGTVITATVPSGATTGPITVEVAGEPTATSATDFTVLAPDTPIITLSTNAVSGLSTSTGVASAATNYSVTGTNLGATPITVTPDSTLLEIGTNGTDFTNSLSLSSVGGVLSNSIFLRVAATNVVTNYNATISHVSGSASNSLTVSGAITNIPAVLAVSTNALSGFTTTTNVASAAQTFTVTGSNLTTNVTVGAPTGFEVASDGVTFGTNASITPVSGIANAEVSVRLAAGVVSGPRSGSVAVSSTGATQRTVAVSGAVAVPNIPGLLYWNFGAATPTSGTGGDYATWTFPAITQNNNNGTTALLDTTSASTGYTNPFNITASGTTNAGAAARTGSLNTNAGGSAFFEVRIVVPSNTATSITNISFGSRGTSTGPTAYSVRSSTNNFAADVVTNSLTANSAWAMYSAPVAIALSNGTNTVRIYGFGGTGSPGANTANWRIDDLTLALAPSPLITLTGPEFTPFETTVGTPSVIQSVDVSGSNLTGDVVITAPAGFAVSKDGSNFASSVSLTPTDGSLSDWSILLLLTGDTEGSYSGNLTFQSPGAATQTRAVSGIVSSVAVPTIQVTGSFTPFSTTVGTPSEAQSVSVGGSTLNTGIIIVADTTPEAFEISTDGVTYQRGFVSLDQTEGTVAATTVFVRLAGSSVAGSSVGSFSGNLKFESTGATTQNLPISGAVGKGTPVITAPPTATPLVQGDSLGSSLLTGGSVTIGGNFIAGSFAWDDSSITPPVGTTSYGVTFTPTDAANYDTAATNASVTVLSAYQAGYSNWLTEFQLDPQATTGPNAGAPNADPDGDGFSNASEYAFGTNPKVPNGALLTTTSSNSVFRSSWIGPASGVSYGVQFSTNLSTMAFSNDPTITIESVGGVMSFTNQATGNKFFRVRATSN